MRLNVLFEHPTWSAELLAGFDAAGHEIAAVDVGAMMPSLPQLDSGAKVDMWVNRVNAMPSAGRPPSVVATTGHLLLALEAAGQLVFNGFTSFAYGGSKAAQTTLFATAGACTPASVLITQPAQALAAAERLGYPVLTKPNIGGSGSSIARHDNAASLRVALEAGTVDLGVDGTGVVQQIITSVDGLVHRIEMLGSDVLYATDQVVQDGAFNYCAVDGCASGDGDETDSIALVDPDPEMIAVAAAVMDAADADIGGIEYLISADDGRPYVYDFNPYSNFITGRDADLGFNPVERYIDAVVAKAGGPT